MEKKWQHESKLTRERRIPAYDSEGFPITNKNGEEGNRPVWCGYMCEEEKENKKQKNMGGFSLVRSGRLRRPSRPKSKFSIVATTPGEHGIRSSVVRGGAPGPRTERPRGRDGTSWVRGGGGSQTLVMLVRMVVVVVVMIAIMRVVVTTPRRPHRVPSVAARPDVLQPLEPLVRPRVGVQLEIQLALVRTNVLKRLGRAVRALGPRPPQILGRGRPRAFAERSPNGQLGAVAAPRGGVPRVGLSDAVHAALALRAGLQWWSG